MSRTVVLDLRDFRRRLGDRDFKLLWLAYVQGFSLREIADLMAINVASIKTTLARARRKARRLLAFHDPVA